MFAIPGELQAGNEVTQAEVFIRIAKANHVRAEERHRLVTNMYLPCSDPDVSSVYPAPVETSLPAATNTSAAN